MLDTPPATPSRPVRKLVLPGDRLPDFTARATVNPAFRLDAMAGRWLVLGVIGSAAAPGMAERIARVWADPSPFDDDSASIFLISQDRSDETTGRLGDRLPGRRVFRDDDLRIARLLGALPADGAAGADMRLAAFWLVLDPSLTVQRVIPFLPDGSDVDALLAHVAALPPVDRWLGFEIPAPILILPQVFEPELCDHLIGLYDRNGGEVSGFMRDRDGKTVPMHDPSFKVRRDFLLNDRRDIETVQSRILRRVVPQIERVHFFKATRMERYLVACYDADEGGHFRPHRDNTTLGTAHRRYAVSINLNDDFDGGEVSFPEYSRRGFKAPRGGAVIFSCAALHAVARVTSGRRYAFLPFLYDDAAAAIREANAARVPSAANYRA